MKKLYLLPLIFFMFLAPNAFACVDEGTISKGYVTPEWLEEYAGGKDLVIIDVSFSREDYEKGHIPSARFLDWRKDIADRNENKYYRRVSQEGFEEAMGEIGVTPGDTLIFYDNKQNRLAIRALWVAAYYGHKNAAILEGGISAWKSAGYRIAKEIPDVSHTQYRVTETFPAMNVDKAFVKGNLHNERVVFVDSRPRRMFTGEIPGKIIHTGQDVSRIGHLPGAVNIPWKSNMNANSLFLGKDALLELYRGKGVTGEKTIVFYCNEGLHAAFNWFVAEKILGLTNVRIYEGSMGEWADDPLLPMVSGIGF